MENQFVTLLVKALDDKKAIDIRVLKIDEVTSLTDYFIICNGTSSTHVRALADECEFVMDKAGMPVRHREGLDSGSWILLDYGDIIVHVYNKEARGYYNLEKVWKDGQEVPVDDMLK
jgi:ribosome-associated protein